MKVIKVKFHHYPRKTENVIKIDRTKFNSLLCNDQSEKWKFQKFYNWCFLYKLENKEPVMMPQKLPQITWKVSINGKILYSNTSAKRTIKMLRRNLWY